MTDTTTTTTRAAAHRVTFPTIHVPTCTAQQSLSHQQ